MKKLVLFFKQMENIHLKKDVGLFPIYLSKYFDKVEILHFPLKTFEPMPKEYRGIALKSLNKVSKYYQKLPLAFFQYLKFKKTLIKYLKNNNVTHLMLFHYNYFHLDIINSIKSEIPNIKVWLKLDCSVKVAEDIIYKYSLKRPGIKGLILNNLIEKGIKNIDLITTETTQTFEILKTNKNIYPKLFLVYNGYDDELYIKPDISKKEKTIITVGRLGTFQKNTELLLEIIKELDLKDWKIKLIGPIEKDEKNFQNDIEKFYLERPDLKDKVTFTGEINDSQKLLKEYQKASVFILTSRHESSALVLLEAAINGCYVLTTDVGIAKDLNYCYICPNSSQDKQDTREMIKNFSSKLQQIINKQNTCFESFDKRIQFYKDTFLMSKIADNKFFKEWCI